MGNEQTTTIQISLTTKAWLDQHKLCDDETYNSELKRLLKVKEGSA